MKKLRRVLMILKSKIAHKNIEFLIKFLFIKHLNKNLTEILKFTKVLSIAPSSLHH